MACPNKNRHRPRTVAFRLTDEEFMRLDQRVKVTGEVKGDYLREIALNGEIKINVGKFKSDKLALYLKRLSTELYDATFNRDDEELKVRVVESMFIIEEIYKLMLKTSDESRDICNAS